MSTGIMVLCENEDDFDCIESPAYCQQFAKEYFDGQLDDLEGHGCTLLQMITLSDEGDPVPRPAATILAEVQKAISIIEAQDDWSDQDAKEGLLEDLNELVEALRCGEKHNLNVWLDVG